MSFAHLTIATADVNPITEFFDDVMGWPRIPVPANVEMKVGWLDIGGGGQLHVIDLPIFSVSDFEAEYGRHFAFFASATQLSDLKKRLRFYGVSTINPIRSTPFERIFFRDPNDYMIEVINRDEWVVETDDLAADINVTEPAPDLIKALTATRIPMREKGAK